MCTWSIPNLVMSGCFLRKYWIQSNYWPQQIYWLANYIKTVTSNKNLLESSFSLLISYTKCMTGFQHRFSGFSKMAKRFEKQKFRYERKKGFQIYLTFFTRHEQKQKLAYYSDTYYYTMIALWSNEWSQCHWTLVNIRSFMKHHTYVIKKVQNICWYLE